MWLLYLTSYLAVTYANIYNHLFETLLGSYNRLVRPAVDANDTIHIEFKLKLNQIVDVHAKHQTLTANGWLIHHWYDHRLSWKPEEYGGIRNFYVPGEMIWLPDIILYNNAHGSPWVSAITKAHVYYDGRVTWEPPVVYHSFCTMNVEWYPYDIQQCELKFGSWTYSGTQLDLMHLLSDDVKYVVRKNESEWDVERGVDVSTYQESVEWDLLSILGTRHEKWYPCCDYPSVDITYYLQIRRKKLFYTVNLIVPCASLAALTSWVFYLPCESHEKVQLCISVLVSLTVFILLLVEIIPPTSIVMPLIVKYLSFTMVMVSLSVGFTVFVQNIHFRTANFPISDRIRQIFIDTLGRKLLISRATEAANFHRKAQHNKQINALSAMSILQKQFHKTALQIEMAAKAKKPMSTVNSLFLELPMMNRSMSVKAAAVNPQLRQNNKDERHRKTSIHLVKSYTTSRNQQIRRRGSAVRNKLRRAEQNVHYIAQTLTERRQAEETEADWQFISLVIDRILLVIFATFISAGTLITFLSAPSITDTRQPITSM
ncbi:hypothetical protein V3C99_005545 [Haemonchus contortus]